MEEVTWKEIREIQMNERKSPTLQKIDPDTYTKILEYINERKKVVEEARKDGSEIALEMAREAEKEMKNAKKMLDDIIYRRNEKIVKNAVRSVYSGVEDTSNMTEEEVELYKKVLASLRKFKSTIFGKKDEIKVKKGIDKLKMVRLVSDVPQFTFDGIIFGPFKKEDIANLPTKVAEILINAGKANLVGDKNEDAKGN